MGVGVVVGAGGVVGLLKLSPVSSPVLSAGPVQESFHWTAGLLCPWMKDVSPLTPPHPTPPLRPPSEGAVFCHVPSCRVQPGPALLRAESAPARWMTFVTPILVPSLGGPGPGGSAGDGRWWGWGWGRVSWELWEVSSPLSGSYREDLRAC